MTTKAEEALNILHRKGEAALAELINENMAPVQHPADRAGAIMILTDHSAVMETDIGCRFLWMDDGAACNEERRLSRPLHQMINPPPVANRGSLSWPSPLSVVQKMLQDSERRKGHLMAHSGALPDDTFHDQDPEGLTKAQDAVTQMPLLLEAAEKGLESMQLTEALTERLEALEDGAAHRAMEALSTAQRVELDGMAAASLEKWRDQDNPYQGSI